jgi:hypothetical protein
MFQKTISHSAFSDEAYYRNSRFRSIALISLEKAGVETVAQSLELLISDSDMSEFKWSDLGGARERFAAKKLINESIKLSLEDKLRIDVLIWDIKDNRHDINRRDDNANLQIMYYHLFNSTLRIRWPSGSVWELFPDEQSIINWEEMGEVLLFAGKEFREARDLFSQNQFLYDLFQDYKIQRINELDSKDCSLIQVADLFAGIGAYSHSCYDKYVKWKKENSNQISMEILQDSEEELIISNRDKERCEIIDYLNKICKSNSLSVSLETNNGFISYKPSLPINFWLYEPQHPEDKAPTKS